MNINNKIKNYIMKDIGITNFIENKSNNYFTYFQQ